MRLSLLALTGAAIAAASEYDRPDFTGAYWDVSVSTQTGRPGYTITDFSASFHSPLASQAVEGKCHYSFVPQGTSPPAETNECTGGLKYEWNYTNVTFLEHTVVLGNETVLMFGLSTKIETTRRSDGMSSTTTGSGKVGISHYCGYGGCGYANGCISSECNAKKTGGA
ncbi:uncharacterized protein M421DRAFT_426489 [Didymella exigua CBS 183.55]|uniref:AA1-like domain-containing protein n=1 Tax=Didymella exigua CBS 183.55 TaxID=1150837 RepID=A0A6A5R6L9_9PLEO|nr:uncharacterized protein M421DRAFT_426489 [Didymella exigua CBS 183.55]KAF1922870.1 hypothetical protein M421DRAFT_426489 [Didymella exigua CBS 183.55]